MSQTFGVAEKDDVIARAEAIGKNLDAMVPLLLAGDWHSLASMLNTARGLVYAVEQFVKESM